jgi:hypothetical protein
MFKLQLDEQVTSENYPYKNRLSGNYLKKQVDKNIKAHHNAVFTSQYLLPPKWMCDF